MPIRAGTDAEVEALRERSSTCDSRNETRLIGVSIGPRGLHRVGYGIRHGRRREGDRVGGVQWRKEAKMRGIAIGGALTVVGVLVARRLAPRLHARLLAGCERMFAEMPDSFPPKRMMRGIEEIHANTVRTLEMLGEREQLGDVQRLAEPSSTRAAGHVA